MAETKRKGATRVADVPAEVLRDLNAGLIETATLAESLAMDFNQLLGNTLPELEVDIDPKAGVTKRMAAVGVAIIERYGDSKLGFLTAHPSDLVRGWGAYVQAGLPDIALGDRIERMRPFADDPHFGAREWAWLTLRPHIVAQPVEAIGHLQSWVTDPSANIRRFAIEATRPRGVWSAHIAVLKTDPEKARVLLDPVTADPARYVQDSVANWLNDAWKTSPDWVETYCAGLSSASDETRYIVKRALRNKS